MVSQLVTLGGWRAGNEWPLFHSLFSFTFYVFSVFPPDLYWSEKYPNFMIVKSGWILGQMLEFITFHILHNIFDFQSWALSWPLLHTTTLIFPYHILYSTTIQYYSPTIWYYSPTIWVCCPPFLCARFCPSLTGGLVSFLMTCQAGWRNRAQVTDCRFSE